MAVMSLTAVSYVPRTHFTGGDEILLTRVLETDPVTEAPRKPRPKRPVWRRLWLAATLLLVLAASLLVRGDVAPKSESKRTSSSVTLALPPPVNDVAVLLTNTPLAIAPTDAIALNAERALDRVPTNFAKPFFVPAATTAELGGGATAAIECMTQAIYYEAASESDTGMRAVAQVVLNRVRSPIFPHTVCGVVFQGSQQRTGCQFSFTCDGSLMRRPSLAGWMHARRVALAALSGSIERSVGLSTHYHANYVVPYWANSLDKVATIGAHIFYTMRGSLGRPPAFGVRYDASAEALPAVLPAPDPNADPVAELVGVNRTGEPTDPLGVFKPNRTLVKDDLLGAPSRPAPVPVAPKPALRADESRGELVADKTKGTLAK
jgi:hypothetical protein